MTLRHTGSVLPAPIGMVFQGPIVKVTLGPHPDDAAATIAAGGIPKTITHNLLVDTGAQLTSVENTIAEGLGLVPIRFVSMMGVSGKPEDYPLYRMGVTIGMQEVGTGSAAQAVFAANIVGTPSPPNPLTHIGLLGRDFLQHVRLTCDGPKGSFEIVDYRHVSLRPTPLPSIQKPSLPSGWREIETARRRSRKHKRRR